MNGKGLQTRGSIHIFSAFKKESMFTDDGYFTLTSTEQKRVEDLVSDECRRFYADFLDSPEDESVFAPLLSRTLHTHYLCRCLREVGKSATALWASKPWICYWGIHSLRLLEAELDESLCSAIVRFLKTCEAPGGGYGGGAGQIPHLATTYGAVMALVSIGTEEALSSINRGTLKQFLKSMKLPDGSFKLHQDGEIDIRGIYCALAVASITNILDVELAENADSWLISCQTYEGGFGGERSCEAHGGYTFCGVAALTILGKTALIHGPSLLKWLTAKQMKFEGGFQGRTNKLVDGCYSFWQAAVFPMVEMILKKSGMEMNQLFDAQALQEFILVCCQDKDSGGLRDKPDKSKDMYHTCYALSGLSIAQVYTPDNIVGGSGNLLAPTSPVYNVTLKAEKFAREFFMVSEVL